MSRIKKQNTVRTNVQINTKKLDQAKNIIAKELLISPSSLARGTAIDILVERFLQQCR